MSSPAVVNFMKQQGFPDEPAGACNMHFEGLYFQPRIVFPAVLLATLLQSAWMHLAISAVLSWNTLLPGFNPFELAYNRWIAVPGGRQVLSPAPGPRRMAQGMAAALNLGAGLALLSGAAGFAWTMEACLAVGFSALLFGKFCIGAYLFHVLKGRVAFANATLPWARPRES